MLMNNPIPQSEPSKQAQLKLDKLYKGTSKTTKKATHATNRYRNQLLEELAPTKRNFYKFIAYSFLLLSLALFITLIAINK